MLHYYSSRPGLWPIVVGVLKGGCWLVGAGWLALGRSGVLVPQAPASTQLPCASPPGLAPRSSTSPPRGAPPPPQSPPGMSKEYFGFELGVELVESRDGGADHEVFRLTYPYQVRHQPQSNAMASP